MTRFPFTFPASRVEIRLRTFIIVVGATGLKLEIDKTQINVQSNQEAPFDLEDEQFYLISC